MMGEVALFSSVVSLILCGCYVLWMLVFGKFARSTEQSWSTALILLGLGSFALLAAAWDTGPPGYPIVLTCAVTGSIVGNASILMLFPLITTYYGGWLVAPVRAGTDISSMITAFLAELQSPDGDVHTYPTWLLFLFYTGISSIGLVAWTVILRNSIGLRQPERIPSLKDASAVKTPTQHPNPEGDTDINSDGSSTISSEHSTPSTAAQEPRNCWAGCMSLRCPRQLVWPVVLATLTQITQWALAGTLGQIGAEMTDPEACDGKVGRHVWRLSLTLSQILVPMGSLLSSLATCPRWLFTFLCLLQYGSCLLICMSTGGLGRSFWTSHSGQALYVASFAACGGLEGYLITMAYRYIGDAPSVPKSLKHSAGALLSLLTVIVVNFTNIFLGSSVTAEQIACVDPGVL